MGNVIGYLEGPNALSNHDLSHLADWADKETKTTPSPSWKRAYALIREGADLLLRRRAMSTVDEEPIIVNEVVTCNTLQQQGKL